jgi:hypothetical protein
MVEAPTKELFTLNHRYTLVPRKKAGQQESERIDAQVEAEAKKWVTEILETRAAKAPGRKDLGIRLWLYASDGEAQRITGLPKAKASVNNALIHKVAEGLAHEGMTATLTLVRAEVFFAWLGDRENYPNRLVEYMNHLQSNHEHFIP